MSPPARPRASAGPRPRALLATPLESARPHARGPVVRDGDASAPRDAGVGFRAGAKTGSSTPPADDECDSDQHAAREQPCDDALGNGPEMAKSPAAAVVGPLRELDVADDRVELPVAQLLFPEARHDPGADAHRLGDLSRRRLVEYGRNRADDKTARTCDLMTARAMLGEE